MRKAVRLVMAQASVPHCIPYIPGRRVPYVIRELQAQNLFQLLPVRDVTPLLIREFVL
jgi:hypothetical protein